MPDPIYHDAQEVTVIDARNTRGRGVMRKDANGDFQCAVLFRHYTANSSRPWPVGDSWTFHQGQREWLGLTIEPHPFTEEIEAVRGILKDDSPADPDPRDAEIARLREALEDASSAMRMTALAMESPIGRVTKKHVAHWTSLFHAESQKARAVLSADPLPKEPHQ